jgi:hypothetical protein
MKAYISTTGIIFGLIVVAHVLRVAAEGSHVARDPFFLVMTGLAAGMCLWAVSLLRATKP